MTVLSVPGMHCEKCVERITNVLNDAGLKFTVSLENKSVAVDGDENAVKTAISEIEDIGFDVEAK